MNSGAQNLVISLGAMQRTHLPLLLTSYSSANPHDDVVARKIPFEDPLVLNYVRAGYVLAQVIVLGVYYYVSLVVSALFRASLAVLLRDTRLSAKTTKRC
jgi:hypothetical protein